MEREGKADRRATASRPLKPGALRCESCGTTWFDRMAQFYAAACRCRRCGGRLHGERRMARAALAA